MKIKVNTYKLYNPKIKSSKTILTLSDIHSNIKALDKILDFLNCNKVDYILIPGDVVDILNLKNEKEFLKRIKDLTKYAPVYISLGNHDKYISKHGMVEINVFKSQEYYKTLNKIPNLHLFINELDYIELDDISISSIVLPNDYYKKKENIDIFNSFIRDIDKKEKINKNKFNIMLIHSPNAVIQKKKIINYSKAINKTNLILCGHNHGGLTPTTIQDLFNNHYGIVGPFSRLIQRNAYGLWTNDHKNLLVSNGVTKVSGTCPFKLLHGLVNKMICPEIDLIYLENKNEESFKLINRRKYE